MGSGFGGDTRTSNCAHIRRVDVLAIKSQPTGRDLFKVEYQVATLGQPTRVANLQLQSGNEIISWLGVSTP